MKQILQTATTVFTWLMVALAVVAVVFTVISVRTSTNGQRQLFGYQALIVRSDSMSATDFGAGDIVFIKAVDPATLQPSDIIAFQSTNPESYGEIITHKIYTLSTDDTGAPCFVTYGTTTGAQDGATVAYSQVQGKYVGHVPGVGRLFAFLKTKTGYFWCVFLPFSALLAYQAVRCVQLFLRMRREQRRAAVQVKAEQAAQRFREEKKQRALQQELDALRQQLAQRGEAPRSFPSA